MKRQPVKSSIKSKHLSFITCTVVAAMIAIPPLWSNATEHEKTLDEAPEAHRPQPEMSGMSNTGDLDYDFAINMRMHHQMGVEMAKYQVDNGKNQQMIGIANQIIAAQKAEISAFDKWLMEYEKTMNKTAP